jgi:hypothetical protein
MSDIPYSVRGSLTSVNKLRGLNFGTIEDNEMFKKVDANNVGGTKLTSTATVDSNVLRMFADIGPFEVLCGYIEAQSTGGVQKLHLNNTGDKEDGITITSTKRVGIGTFNPGEKLEVKGAIKADGTISAPTFTPTYITIPSLVGKIGQIVDAGQPTVALVFNNLIQVRSLTIPYTGVWLIGISLFLGNAAGLTGDIRFPTDIKINGTITHNFYGTNLTGVNGIITRILSLNDVVTFSTYLAGSGASGMTPSERAVYTDGYTFLTATRIA